MAEGSTRPQCEFCGKMRCRRFSKLPIGTPIKRVARICSRCLVNNMQGVRAWLEKQEKLP